MAEKNIILNKERDTEISCNTSELIQNSSIKKQSKELIETNFARQHCLLFCFFLVYYFLQREPLYCSSVLVIVEMASRMLNAVVDVKKGLTVRAAAEKHGVAKSTLHPKCQGIHTAPRGRPTKFEKIIFGDTCC